MHRCPFTLKTGKAQRGLEFPERIDEYKRAMLAGEWTWEKSGQSFTYWRTGSVVYIGEGHHRMNAAMEIGR